jgi:hypothetical protein
MGKHIIPQFYLRGFACSESMDIWVFDKEQIASSKLLPIKTTAQGKDFYDDKTENILANEIEAPANRLLDVIRKGNYISESDKSIFGDYLFALYKRVPKGMQRYKKVAPKVGEKMKPALYRQLESFLEENPSKIDLYNRFKEVLDKTFEDLEHNPPKEFWYPVITTKNPTIPLALSQMNWAFLKCQDDDLFITSDNPVFIHESIGIAAQESELTFPVSSKVALFISRIANATGYVKAHSRWVKEINKRTIANATRFVYSSKKFSWIPSIMEKKYQPRLLVNL